MTKFSAKVSLALWQRRLAYREKRHAYWHRRHDAKHAAHWHHLVEQAQAMIAKRKQQLAADAKPIPAKGLDVSNLQGHIDWAKVQQAGYRFVWIKAGEGDWHDPNFLVNVRMARANGLKVGAYHFLRPKPGRTGAQEAAFFIARLKEAGLGKGDLLPAADVEATKLGAAATRRYAWDFMQAVHRAGHHPVLYTYPSFMGGDWGGDAWISWPLWLADYGGPLNVPKPWKHPAAHQYTSEGNVPGIRGNVDLNRTDDLRSLIA